MRKMIAITGGIGAGKSVVSKIVRAMGHYVYDCDSEAKKLMDRSCEIKRRLQCEIDSRVVDGKGVIDRTLLADIVFQDNVKLEVLNSIVHSAVREDVTARFVSMPEHCVMFVETAILYQSGLDLIVDEVWCVNAPEELRIERVMKRNGCSRENVVARIESQHYEPVSPHGKVIELINDSVLPLLPQVERAIAPCL